MVRATVPKMNLDDVFEQKSEIAKSVADELAKVCYLTDFFLHKYFCLGLLCTRTLKLCEL